MFQNLFALIASIVPFLMAYKVEDDDPTKILCYGVSGLIYALIGVIYAIDHLRRDLNKAPHIQVKVKP